MEPDVIEPTPEQFAELRRIVQVMRNIALPVGPMHCYWDVIADVDSMTGFYDSQPVMKVSPAEMIAYCHELLSKKS